MQLIDLYDLIDLDTYQKVQQQIVDKLTPEIQEQIDRMLAYADVDDWNDANETEREPSDIELEKYGWQKTLDDFVMCPKSSKEEAEASGAWETYSICSSTASPYYYGKVVSDEEKLDKILNLLGYGHDGLLDTIAGELYEAALLYFDKKEPK